MTDNLDNVADIIDEFADGDSGSDGTPGETPVIEEEDQETPPAVQAEEPAPPAEPKSVARPPAYSGNAMVVHQTDSKSFGVMTLSSGTYSVKTCRKEVLLPGRVTAVSPGVRLNLPRDIIISLQLPKDAHRDLVLVNRDQSDRIGDRQHIPNLTVFIHNTSDTKIKLPRGTPIATITTHQHQPIAIMDAATVMKFQNIVNIPSTVFSYIAFLTKEDVGAFINRYFADRDPMPDIKEAADFKPDDYYISSALFKAMNSEQREQIKLDYEQYKRQKVGGK